jgi:RimJ/RimL family protein N-acetyltransferase
MTNPSKTILYDQHARVGQWVAEGAGIPWRPDMRALGLERNGELIAGTLYEDFNGASVIMHQRNAGPGSLTRAFVFDCFAYPFIQLGCSVLIGVAVSSNHAAIRMNEHLGFERTAVIEGAHPSGDYIIFTMRREQCRFLTWGTRL